MTSTSSDSKLYQGNLDTPVGQLVVSANEKGITSVSFTDSDTIEDLAPSSPLTDACIQQLEAYFNGDLKDFNLPLAPEGTPFQLRVWDALQSIPHGRTTSYGELALKLGDIKTTRAVGTANGSNPIAVIIPCHRVIGADGSLTGYAGGLWRKQWLLKHESSQGTLF